MNTRNRRLIPAGLVVVVAALLAIQFAPGMMPGTATQAPAPATAASASTAEPSAGAAATAGTDEETATGGGEDRDAQGGAELHTSAAEPKMFTGASKPVVLRHPNQLVLKAARSRVFDLRKLPKGKIIRLERNEVEPPRGDSDATDSDAPSTDPDAPTTDPDAPTPDPDATDPDAVTPSSVDPNAMVKIPANSAPAPAANSSFAGLDFQNWGSGHPPDTNGDVGPTYYIQTINSSIGIYDKSTGTRVTAFTFNSFMSQGSFGNLCDTDNFGDPVVLYDSFEDRWVITDFAFQLSSGNVVNPPGSFECVAVSKSGDPVTGGWNFYSVNTTGGLGDYPKFGVWPDGIYWSANMFGYASGAPFQNPRVYAMNKAQMYAGEPTAQILTFDAPADDFSLVPSNARLQSGTPPAGTPDYFVSTWDFLNAVNVYAFHVDWTRPSTSTFSGPFSQATATSWPNATVPNAPSQGGNALDVLQIRAMMQNQYTNIGGVESLWAVHTVRRADTSGFAAPRYYQLDVSGGTVAGNAPQAATWDPDGANVMYRFMPSVAVDRIGDMAMGYSTSSSTTKPAIKYAGRLSTDPANTFSETEQTLVQGTGTQTGSCGGTCARWGDYSAMTLDPDGCTFWYTNQYYAVDGLDHQTQIGSFKYPECTPNGAGGAISGTVTESGSGNPLSGATVALGSRSTTTAPDGTYSFAALPAGTYPTIAASAAAHGGDSAAGIAVTDGGTTTRNFVLAAAPATGNFIDTTKSDFQAGAPGGTVDLTTTPGDVTLSNAPIVDQKNETLGTSGVGISITTFGGQTFTPSVTGLLTSADINLFCNACTGTTPNLTLSLRATSGGLPTGADLASATITGFSNGGVASYFSVTFASPVTVTAGTMYALVIRPTANPSPGTYALTRSGTSTAGADVYAGGTRVAGATSGTVWSIPTTGGVTTDAGFHVNINAGYRPSGTFTSSVKDANPAAAGTPTWPQLSWTADVPHGTSLTFQAAASDHIYGPFNFVGPDGTSGTTFSSGDSLSEFNGKRYLQYRATLGTADTSVTPAVHDVTIGYANVLPSTALAVDPATGTYGGTTTLSATLTASSSGLSGKTVAFTLNGTSVGAATTNGSGVATLPGVSLTGIDAGSYPTGVGATFAGDSGNGPSSNTASLSIDKATATLALDAGTLNQNFDGTPKSVTVTSTPPGLSGISVTYDGSPTAPSAAGSYAISATLSNTNYQATPATGTLVIGSFARSGSTISVSAVRVSPNSGIQFSDSITLRATVTGAVVGGHVKGTVTFRVNGNPSAGIAVAVDGTSPVTVYTPLQLSSAVIPSGAGKYRLSARFSPSTGSDYNGSRTKHMQIVRPEGVDRNGVLDGSTRLVYTGPTSVAQGVNPILSANLLQSQGSASADHEFVDFSGGAVQVVFRLYQTNCGSCPTGPVYVSAPTSVVNAPSWATTGTGTASVKAPRRLAPGTYKVTITRVVNRYVSVKTSLANLTIT